MIDEKKKMTAQGSSVGADDGQSISKTYENSIPTSGQKSNDEIVKLPGQSGRNVSQDAAHDRPPIPAYTHNDRAVPNHL